MSPAERVFEEAFARPRTPRSGAYKAGALAALIRGLEGTPTIPTFEPGTPELDAWLSGYDEGRRLARLA